MTQSGKGESLGGDAEPEPQNLSRLETAQRSLQEFFGQRPHPFGTLGILLERQELAGPPVSPEDAAERAAMWRLLHLEHHLGIAATDADWEATNGGPLYEKVYGINDPALSPIDAPPALET